VKPEEKCPSVIYKAFDEQWRRRGIGKRLVEEAFAQVGAERMDLISSDESLNFYGSLNHKEQVGFRIYPAGVEAS
jgi:ribosomal protein S18 acetylase RimI-like enzyme